MTRDEAHRIAANIAKAAGAAAKVLIEVFLKALPLLIELRTNRFTGNIDVMGQQETNGSAAKTYAIRSSGRALPDNDSGMVMPSEIDGCPVELPDIKTLGNWAPGDYSITSSAVSTRSREIVRPKLLAAFRLMTSSNFVGCWTGNSAGLAPLRSEPHTRPSVGTIRAGSCRRK